MKREKECDFCGGRKDEGNIVREEGGKHIERVMTWSR